MLPRHRHQRISGTLQQRLKSQQRCVRTRTNSIYPNTTPAWSYLRSLNLCWEVFFWTPDPLADLVRVLASAAARTEAKTGTFSGAEATHVGLLMQK